MDIGAILQVSDIAPALLQSPQSRVSATNYSALWLAVARTLDDELFGQDSRRMKVGSFAMMCRTLIHCRNLKSALVRMLRFFNLLLDDFYCSLDETGEDVRILIQERTHPQGSPASAELPDRCVLSAISAISTISAIPAISAKPAMPPQPRIFGHETLLMMQHGLACWLIGRRIPISAAGFAYAEPVYSEEYSSMYSTRLAFNQSVTSLGFAPDYLALPVVQNARTATEFLSVAPANIVLKYKNKSSFSANIRRRLRVTARTEWPDFDTFAKGLNMTGSTLRRRLGEEGQSYQSIKDQLRRDMAIDYLSHSDKSVMEIAVELGFAEPSAFHRAFKKWTGSSPGEYRQRAHAS